jgi:hypothetical protein
MIFDNAYVADVAYNDATKTKDTLQNSSQAPVCAEGDIFLLFERCNKWIGGKQRPRRHRTGVGN